MSFAVIILIEDNDITNICNGFEFAFTEERRNIMRSVWNLNNVSALFSNFKNTNGTSSFINFNDYSAIKNGSYRKLVKSYYDLDKQSSSIKTDTVKKNEVYTADKSLSQMKVEADELKKSTEALSDSSLWKQSNGSYDLEKITKAVKTFADDYNDVIDQSAKVSNKDISQYKSWMSSMTNTMSNSLSKVGITVGVDGKLSVDEEAVKKADVKNLKALFSGNNSYASQIEQKASSISSAALRNNSLYTSDGTLSSALGSTFTGWM